MSIQGGGQDSFLSEINVTPFVDVLLVLLVLFIVTLPIVIQTLPVNLPKASIPDDPPVSEPVYVAVDSKGRILYGEKLTSLDDLVSELKKSPEDSITVVIQADKVNEYGLIVNILSRLRSEGFEKVGLSVDNSK